MWTRNKNSDTWNVLTLPSSEKKFGLEIRMLIAFASAAMFVFLLKTTSDIPYEFS